MNRPDPWLQYPEWQRPVFAAILEPDRGRLDERVQHAEAAVFKRLLSLVVAPNLNESAAISEAISALRVLESNNGHPKR
jgi:hypothetical protein